MKSIELTAATFDQAIRESSLPVLVDFHAEWCGPCRMMGPVVDEVAAARSGTAVVAKLNIDDAQDIAQRYRISSIPTLIVFKDGKPVSTVRGGQSRAAIEAMLDSAK